MKTKKKLLAIIALLILIVGGYIFYNVTPVNTNVTATIKINENRSLSSILEELEQKQLIRNKTIAYWYARMFYQANLISGEFQLNSNQDILSMLNTMSDYNNNVDEPQVTLLPGGWAKHYAQQISEVTNYSSEEIINKWNDANYIEQLQTKYWFLKDLVINSDIKILLEGYLYPDTYNINSRMSIEEITEKILVNTDVKLSQYQEQLMNMNIHEFLTRASLMQYEAKTYEDMQKIAQVVENRLVINQKLQLSATVCYSLYDNLSDWKQCELDTNIDSKYNTYLYEGLPPSPIDNPAGFAIEAILNPIKHDFYYFVADVCGDQSVYYSRTYAEHEELVDQYLTQKGCIN